MDGFDKFTLLLRISATSMQQTLGSLRALFSAQNIRIFSHYGSTIWWTSQPADKEKKHITVYFSHPSWHVMADNYFNSLLRMQRGDDRDIHDIDTLKIFNIIWKEKEITRNGISIIVWKIRHGIGGKTPIFSKAAVRLSSSLSSWSPPPQNSFIFGFSFLHLIPRCDQTTFLVFINPLNVSKTNFFLNSITLIEGEKRKVGWRRRPYILA